MVKSLFLVFLFAAPAMAGEKTYTQAQVAQHKSASDCWLLIDGGVYDVTEYVSRHRKHDYDITKHCGRESSTVWNEKPGNGEAHSRKAERLLRKYRIGTLAK